MIGLDTNVIVRYLTQDDPVQAPIATRVINGLREDSPGYIPTVVWAETYWVLTRSYGFRRNDVVERLSALSLADEIRAEDPAGLATAFTAARRGADLADALIDTTANRVGCEAVVTFDKRAADRLGWRLADELARKRARRDSNPQPSDP